MTAIWKYELLSGAIEVPLGAIFLTCQAQGVQWCVWMEVDPNEKRTETRAYRIVGTGHEFDPKGLEYFATIQSNGLVWHFYWERTK